MSDAKDNNDPSKKTAEKPEGVDLPKDYDADDMRQARIVRKTGAQRKTFILLAVASLAFFVIVVLWAVP